MAFNQVVGTLNRLVTFQQKSVTQDPDFGTEVRTWSTYATLWANVQDVLPSRAESQSSGIRIETRPARLRMRYRTDITSDMRVVIDGATYQIVGGPAQLGRREGIEMMVAAYSSSGEAA